MRASRSRFEAALPAVCFGDLLGAGELAGGDAEGGGQRPDGPCGRCGATIFEACDGEGVNARPARQLGLGYEARQAQAAESVWE